MKVLLTEEAILNPDFMGPGMKDWRRYRIEYGYECSCPEGIIYLPPDMSPCRVEEFLENFFGSPCKCFNQVEDV